MSPGIVRPPASRTGPRDDAGFVLPAVILTLVVLGALASAGFVLTRTDVEISANHRSSVEADNAAQRGLARYLSDHERPGGDTTYVFGEDTARITVTRLLEVDETVGDTLLRITSVGIHPSSRAVARRTLSRLLLWGGRTKPFTAAAAAGGDLDLHDEDAVLSGVDDCSAAPDVAGGASTSDGWHDHSNQQVSGSPPVDTSYATGSSVLADAGMDSTAWARIQAGDGIWPDVVITDDKVWPDFDTIPSDRWLLITFQDEDGKFDMVDDYSGRGTIIARGKFEVKKKRFSWDGLILAGEDLSLDEDGTVVEGAVLGGLDAAIGGDGKNLKIEKEDTRIQYHSCNASVASRLTFRVLSEFPGTWTETF